MILGTWSKAEWLASCCMVIIGATIVICVRLKTGESPLDVGERLQMERISIVRENAGEETRGPSRRGVMSPISPGDFRSMENRPAEVMAYIDHLEDRELAVKLTEEFVGSVAGLHYDLLLNWLSRQKDERIAALIFRGMMPRLIRENPEGCISMGMALGEGANARSVRDEFFFLLPLEQRVLLIDRLPLEEKAVLLSRRATGFAERAPDLCLEMIGDLPPSGNRAEALSKLMKAWIGGGNAYHLADPVSAAKGVMGIRDVEFRREALREMSFEWGTRFSSIASRWVGGLPAGPDRDASVEGLVKSLAARDRDAAARWAESIGDETLRDKVIQHLELTFTGKIGKKK